ncbi:hypothetical protein COV42_00230 [Candidatus Campbellbacteria bacterium CG11_big_fil_rev_8_21_14_0_20_44_21]|uniref:Uncharacterized protein n=1 Tax=Candidatus Campbellbacteria bacterium CG22_combo_CG10-13_8_21_14_all_43_18 TaxID=1974530 RepID=A0A2H0DWQ7_9BACT|nr:MAG: hypothetical protein COW82_01160 [Candidatus Campbellbacteria bacterium CG22_combo_CG10-13_8_21_14_all_43_18]PIR24504.1 MAG: hypothetical protein COV42_00230 [Candidatus Campbellbacteria bacterium CG11_big_fil_rev_8_21_14_0_20_44_21]
MKKSLGAIFLSSLPPSFVLAVEKPTSFKELIFLFVEIVRNLIPLFMLLAVLYFFWGIALFIRNTGGGKEKEEAKSIMLWGIIALFVMVSVWGIVGLLKRTFIPGGSADTTFIFPDINFEVPEE